MNGFTGFQCKCTSIVHYTEVWRRDFPEGDPNGVVSAKRVHIFT